MKNKLHILQLLTQHLRNCLPVLLAFCPLMRIHFLSFSISLGALSTSARLPAWVVGLLQYKLNDKKMNKDYNKSIAQTVPKQYMYSYTNTIYPADLQETLD